jgi:hypothetical protein
MKQRRNVHEVQPPRVTPRQFIKVWQESDSVREVATKLRIKKNACRVRAHRYRKLGVPLKEHPPVEIEVIDWSELAQYAAELANCDGCSNRKHAARGDEPQP